MTLRYFSGFEITVLAKFGSDVAKSGYGTTKESCLRSRVYVETWNDLLFSKATICSGVNDVVFVTKLLSGLVMLKLTDTSEVKDF